MGYCPCLRNVLLVIWVPGENSETPKPLRTTPKLPSLNALPSMTVFAIESDPALLTIERDPRVDPPGAPLKILFWKVLSVALPWNTTILPDDTAPGTAKVML